MPLLLLFFMLVVAASAVQGQGATVSDRMVRAFQDYCINADPEQIRADLTVRWGEPFRGADIVHTAAGVIHSTPTLTWTEHGDPHRGISLEISNPDAPRSCRVSAAWGEKAEIVTALAASVDLAEPATDVEHGSEITRWVTRAHGDAAVVELRVAKYISEPGRSLTLLFGGP